MARKAFLCGINYPGTDYELRGCVNDVTLTSEILTKQFGFTTKEKRMLTDASATTANILERLEWLIDGAQPGDYLHFQYSGHGSQVIDSKYDTDYEPDGLDEIICPVDLNWRDKMITDDMLKDIFNRVPQGVHLSVILDSCHSGTALDQIYQYQPLGVAKVREFGPDSPNRARVLPMPADIANRGIGLDLKPRERRVKNVDNTGLLISGCQANQTSADAWINNMYCGAATYSFLNALKTHNYEITYKDLVDSMNQFMVQHNFSQRPELNGDAKLFTEKVFGGKKSTGVVDIINTGTTNEGDPLPPLTDPKPSVLKYIIMVASITVIIGIVFFSTLLSKSG